MDPIICQNRRHRYVKWAGQKCYKVKEIDKICFTVSPLSHSPYQNLSYSSVSFPCWVPQRTVGSVLRQLSFLLCPNQPKQTMCGHSGTHTPPSLSIRFEFWKWPLCILVGAFASLSHEFHYSNRLVGLSGFSFLSNGYGLFCQHSASSWFDFGISLYMSF